MCFSLLRSVSYNSKAKPTILTEFSFSESRARFAQGFVQMTKWLLFAVVCQDYWCNCCCLQWLRARPNYGNCTPELFAGLILRKVRARFAHQKVGLGDLGIRFQGVLQGVRRRGLLQKQLQILHNLSAQGSRKVLPPLRARSAQGK